MTNLNQWALCMWTLLMTMKETLMVGDSYSSSSTWEMSLTTELYSESQFLVGLDFCFYPRKPSKWARMRKHRSVHCIELCEGRGQVGELAAGGRKLTWAILDLGCWSYFLSRTLVTLSFQCTNNEVESKIFHWLFCHISHATFDWWFGLNCSDVEYFGILCFYVWDDQNALKNISFMQC